VTEALAAQNIPAPRATRQENLQESLLHGGHLSRPRQPDAAPRIVPQPDDGVIQRPFLLALLFTPFSILYKIFSKAFGLFSFLFPFLPQILRPNPAGTARRGNAGGRRALKPRDSAVRLKREMEEEYGSNTLPHFEGGYAQALDLAKKDLKFLLILLLSPEHDDTSSFIRDTLMSTEVQAFLNDSSNNIILWTGDVRDSEAYQVSNALNCNKFPFTAVVAHDPSVSSTNMSVISRVTGAMDSGTYLAKIGSTISSHEEALAGVRASRSAQNFERTLREEQDAAYERSLAQDRENQRLRREKEAREKAEAERKIRETEAAEKLATNKLQWRKWRASTITEPSKEATDIVRIALKMPAEMAAARVMRQFRAGDGIEELYAFVDCYEFLQDEGGVEKVAKPEGYKHEFDFRLVQTLPRVVYEVSAGGTIGERVGRSGNLIVEPIKDEEEDEEDEEEE
jgi:FAS-associated factor 2